MIVQKQILHDYKLQNKLQMNELGTFRSADTRI